MGSSSEALKILVDNEIVKAVYLIRLEEGIISYWPPEGFDDEVENLADLFSIPMRDGLYFVIGGDELKEKYFGLVINKSILLFRTGEKFHAEKIAEKLSTTYLIHLEKKKRP